MSKSVALASKPGVLSQFGRQIDRIRSISRAFDRVNRLVHLADDVEPEDAFEILAIAGEEALKIDGSAQRENAIDTVLWAYVDYELPRHALIFLARSRSIAARAAWLINLHELTRHMEDAESMKTTEVALANLRPSLNQEEAKEIDRYLKSLKR